MKLFICGDSTAANYAPTDAPQAGWGQVLPELLPGVDVQNRARGGRSTKSYLADGLLQQIETELQAGDLLLIQFAHNDGSDLVWRHTDPWTSFYNNLEIFVDTALLHSVRAVLLTPICCRVWQEGRLMESHGDYPDAVRVLAARRNLPLIDLYAKSTALLRSLGEAESRKLYMNLEPGVSPRHPDGLADNTHTQRAGAAAYAQIVADALREFRLI